MRKIAIFGGLPAVSWRALALQKLALSERLRTAFRLARWPEGARKRHANLAFGCPYSDTIHRPPGAVFEAIYQHVLEIGKWFRAAYVFSKPVLELREAIRTMKSLCVCPFKKRTMYG